MKIKNIFFCLFGSCLFLSCSDNSPDDLIDIIPIEKVTYTANVKSIIDHNCVICHSSPPANGAPMHLTSYEAVREAVLNKGLIDRISRQNGEEGLMPNGGQRLPQSTIEIIKQWQTDGLQQ